MYILIIGGNGLIGSSIAKFLQVLNKKVILCDLKKRKNKIIFFLDINNEKSGALVVKLIDTKDLKYHG